MTFSKKAKRLLAGCITGVMVFTAAMPVFADDAVKVILNDGKTEFNSMMLVDGEVTYLPVRFAFNQNFTANETNPVQNYVIRIGASEENIKDKKISIEMMRKDANGNLINDGRYVEIRWSDDVKGSFANGRLAFIKYRTIGKNEKGEDINEATEDPYYSGLENEVKFVNLDKDGDRIFLSVADIQNIANFLTGGSNYKVEIKKVYTEVKK